MTDCAIEIKGLRKRFGKQDVLKSLDLRVPAGSIYGFVGRNGAGKSTTIKAMLGLLSVDGGQCQVLGINVAEDPVGIRSRVGYMAENQAMYGWMTVRQIIQWTSRFYATWDGAFANELQSQFDLDGAKKVEALSKGQTSKLALLLALAHRPKLVILDDPTLGLDPIARKDFLREVIGQLQVRQVTVFFSSHLLYEIEPICDAIGILDDGRMVRDASTDTLRRDVKRLVIRIPDDSIEVKVPGLLDVEISGRSAALVTQDVTGARAALTAHSLNGVEVQDLNLDEIFEAYVIGRTVAGPFSRGPTS